MSSRSHGEYPLPRRQRRQDVVGEMRRCRHHAPRVARGTHAAPIAGNRDQEVVHTLPEPTRVGDGWKAGILDSDMIVRFDDQIQSEFLRESIARVFVEPHGMEAGNIISV